MRKLATNLSLLALFMLVLGGSARALDLEVQGGMGNTAYDRDRNSPLGQISDSDPDDPEFEAFAPQLFSVYRLAVSGEAGTNLFYRVAYEQDSILRDRIVGNVGIILDRIILEGGPFFGVFNTGTDFIVPGVSFSAKLEYPGVFFAGLQSSSSLGGISGDEGAYSQRASAMQIGLWATSDFLFTFNYETKGFLLQQNDFLLTEDKLSRYFWRGELHIKNRPYTITADLGYQILGRTYLSQEIHLAKDGGEPELLKTSETNELKSIFLGFEGEFVLARSLKLLFGLEMPVFSWTSEDMKKPDGILFEARAGIIWTLPSS